MAVDLLLAAVDMAASPFALAGYIALGVVATSPWRAVKYGFLWALAVHFFAVATDPVGLGNAVQLAISGVLRLIGAIIITLGVHYLYRLLRRGRPGGGPPPPSPPPPRLRRVK